MIYFYDMFQRLGKVRLFKVEVYFRFSKIQIAVEALAVLNQAYN